MNRSVRYDSVAGDRHDSKRQSPVPRSFESTAWMVNTQGYVGKLCQLAYWKVKQ